MTFTNAYLPFFLSSIAVIFGLALSYYLLLIRNEKLTKNKKFQRQIILFLLGFVAFWIVILFLPIEASARGEISTILGIVFSAIFALSSTTLLSNVMAGIVLRISKPFSIGDFIRIDDYFGRVSELGLFSTELQTEERAFVSIPNSYLIKQPLSARLASGTMVSVGLSLGYDLHHKHIEKILTDAATKAELESPFVHILALGDFSVEYRVSGLLTETKQYVNVKSRLYACVLDELHEHRIEIMSPSYMAQRPTDPKDRVIPSVIPIEETGNESKSEPVIFDKAERAQNMEILKEQVASEIELLKKQRKTADDDDKKTELDERIDTKSEFLERLKAL